MSLAIVNYFLGKSFITDVRQGPKYLSTLTKLPKFLGR